MLVLDQLKKEDPQLRAVAVMVLVGLGVLLVGLWWVQIVSSRDYQANLETQSFRTVRIPAVRGRILDRDGKVLAENRPIYNVSLYLDELRRPFDEAYVKEAMQVRGELQRQQDELKKKLNRKLTPEEKRRFVLSSRDRGVLRQRARGAVVSNVVHQISRCLGQPLTLNLTNFERHYERRLALPFPVLSNLDSTNIARFEEQCSGLPGVDVEVLTARVYGFGSTASHLIGHLQRDDSSVEGEEAFFSYRLPDYRGILGIEAGYDKQLRGVAGAKSVQVNNMGYRTMENIWNPAEPGRNVVLTIDLDIQQAAEQALPVFGPGTRGAVVVMNVTNGDVLAMASSPTLNPNSFIQGCTREEWQRITNLQAEKNRATQENYAPGSIFKTIVGLAALEAGLNPKQKFCVAPDPLRPERGIIYVGRPFHDLAAPGEYDFRRALKISSNAYFITNGLRTGVENIIRLGQRLHLGERTGLPTRQETAGLFPDLRRIRSGWSDGNTANMCIGQDPVLVTPLQMAVMTVALANGGKVFWPRLVSRIEPQDPMLGQETVEIPAARLRDELGVRPRNLEVLREAMLADVEDADGTGRRAAVAGLRVCGKTGTAQVKDERGQTVRHTTWFISFAPYEQPRYAMVVMVEVERGGSGAETCAPIAGDIYKAILKRDGIATPKSNAVAMAGR